MSDAHNSSDGGAAHEPAGHEPAAHEPAGHEPAGHDPAGLSAAAQADGSGIAPAPGSGNAAVEAAAKRARETAARNVPSLGGLPLPADTANLREGENLNDALLALIPLVGVWRGTGEGNHPESGDYRFGQEIIVAHNGGEYLAWDSRTWVLDDEQNFVGPDLRESGFWRVADQDGEEVIELLLTHTSGVVELYYGEALSQSSWELATDVVIRSQSAALMGGAKRLYGIVEGGDLAYVEERINPDGELVPRLSARLQRFVG
ncbi:FABP family protein [Lolliginicoccus lacisalsi]|uniref:FABP family protein n=1 Tax=Lolliginicoccus lacisalsi TaxID=2742202 RepID=UPI0038CC17C6